MNELTVEPYTPGLVTELLNSGYRAIETAIATGNTQLYKYSIVYLNKVMGTVMEADPRYGFLCFDCCDGLSAVARREQDATMANYWSCTANSILRSMRMAEMESQPYRACPKPARAILLSLAQK